KMMSDFLASMILCTTNAGLLVLNPLYFFEGKYFSLTLLSYAESERLSVNPFASRSDNAFKKHLLNLSMPPVFENVVRFRNNTRCINLVPLLSIAVYGMASPLSVTSSVQRHTS